MAARFDLAARLAGARNGLLASGFDALLASPGADLRCLTGLAVLPA